MRRNMGDASMLSHTVVHNVHVTIFDTVYYTIACNLSGHKQGVLGRRTQHTPVSANMRYMDKLWSAGNNHARAL